MTQVRIFKSVEGEVKNLENELNKWLAETNVRVIRMFGNIAPQSTQPTGHAMRPHFGGSDVFLVVVYEK
jgi:hypothetical protein